MKRRVWSNRKKALIVLFGLKGLHFQKYAQNMESVSLSMIFGVTNYLIEKLFKSKYEVERKV